jgi:hypothetical protein
MSVTVDTSLIDLRSISTPLDQCVVLEPGPLDTRVVAELRRRDFGQAPVINGSGMPLGVIETRVAEKMLESGQHLSETDQSIIRLRLPMIPSVEVVLDGLSKARGLVVAEESNSYRGLLTVSDLNRHRFRAVLYGAFAELESLLARLIDVSYADHSLWLDQLRGEVRERLDSYWAESKQRGVDIGPQAGCTLTELIEVVRFSDSLRTDLGFKSKSHYDRQTGRLPEYRNRVMHPVRPLVFGRVEVSRLNSVLKEVRTMSEAARQVLAELGLGSRVVWL